MCFLAVDPKRAETIARSAPYVQIDGGYLAGIHNDARILAAAHAAIISQFGDVALPYALSMAARISP